MINGQTRTPPFSRRRPPWPPLARTYFAYPSNNANEQLFYFTSLVRSEKSFFECSKLIDVRNCSGCCPQPLQRFSATIKNMSTSKGIPSCDSCLELRSVFESSQSGERQYHTPAQPQRRVRVSSIMTSAFAAGDVAPFSLGEALQGARPVRRPERHVYQHLYPQSLPVKLLIRSLVRKSRASIS